MHTAALALVGLGLLGGTWWAWRRAGGFGSVGWGWQLAWTIWLAEIALTVVTAPDPAPASAGATGRPLLEMVGGVPVPADLGADPDDRTIVFLGDSFTYGDGVRHRESLPSQVADRLDVKPPVRVLNHGLPGLSFWDQLVIYGAVSARTDPDLVVWVLILNDLSSVSAPGDFIVDRSAPPATGVRLVDVPRAAWAAWEVGQATEAAYQTTWRADSSAVQAFRDELGRVAQQLHARDAELVVVAHPLLHRLDAYPFTEAHHVIGEAARDAGARFVDLLPAYAGRDASELWVSPTDHHPNAAGHALAADFLADALAPALPGTTAPNACDAVPAPAPYTDAIHAACAGDAEDLLTLAHDLATGPWPADVMRPWSGSLVASKLAVIAAHRDPLLKPRADDVITAARATQGGGPR